MKRNEVYICHITILNSGNACRQWVQIKINKTVILHLVLYECET
jgi:hypothetical protein